MKLKTVGKRYSFQLIDSNPLKVHKGVKSFSSLIGPRLDIVLHCTSTVAHMTSITPDMVSYSELEYGVKSLKDELDYLLKKGRKYLLERKRHEREILSREGGSNE